MLSCPQLAINNYGDGIYKFKGEYYKKSALCKCHTPQDSGCIRSDFTNFTSTRESQDLSQRNLLSDDKAQTSKRYQDSTKLISIGIQVHGMSVEMLQRESVYILSNLTKSFRRRHFFNKYKDFSNYNFLQHVSPISLISAQHYKYVNWVRKKGVIITFNFRIWRQKQRQPLLGKNVSIRAKNRKKMSQKNMMYNTHYMSI